MKKLKLLFPLLGTSALAAAPALSAQTHQIVKKNSNHSVGNVKNCPPLNRKNTDENSKLFLNGISDSYYYDGSSYGYFDEANFSFTLTRAGATALAKAKMTSSDDCIPAIMNFLNKNLIHFDQGNKRSYLNEVEGTADDDVMWTYEDGWAWSDFMNHMDQAGSQVEKLVTLLKQGKPLPGVEVKFHYAYHAWLKDDFDVTFTLDPLNPGAKITPNASFTGHFPGMGPYGKAGDQDHAELISSEPESETLKLDLSTASINYINNHYLNRPVSSVPLAVMDYLWKAYPSSDWKSTLSGILRAGGVNAVNYYFGKLVDFIGTYDSDGKTLLVAYPAYYYIKDGDSFTTAKNQPFS